MSPSGVRFGLAALWLLGSSACQKQPAAGGASAGAPTSATSSAVVVAAQAVDAAQPTRDPFVDPLGAATLELSGAVVFPPGAPPAGKPYVFVSHGDCLDASAKPLRRMPVTEDGAFLLHTLATPGSELSVCAVLEPVTTRGDSTLAAFYGQAATRIRVEKTDDLVVHDLQVPLRPGPPRRFAPPSKPGSH